MDNIKFLYFRPTGYGKGYSYSGHVDLVFEVCPKVTKYPEDKLTGKEKILVSLSHYLKGDLPLECFLNDFHLILLEGQMEAIRSGQMFSRASMNL